MGLAYCFSFITECYLKTRFKYIAFMLLVLYCVYKFIRLCSLFPAALFPYYSIFVFTSLCTIKIILFVNYLQPVLCRKQGAHQRTRHLFNALKQTAHVDVLFFNLYDKDVPVDGQPCLYCMM